MQTFKKISFSPVLKFIGIFLSLLEFRSVSIFKKSYREGCLSVTSNYNQIPFSPCNYTQSTERKDLSPFAWDLWVPHSARWRSGMAVVFHPFESCCYLSEPIPPAS